MIRFFLVFCLFCSSLLAEVKITSVQQLQNGIALNFNENIKTSNVKKFLLQDNGILRYVYDIESQLQGSARVFEFQDNVQIKVAQNSKEKVRLVITSSEKLNIELKLNNKQATLTIPNAKLAQSNFSIASLLNLKWQIRRCNQNRRTNKISKK